MVCDTVMLSPYHFKADARSEGKAKKEGWQKINETTKRYDTSGTRTHNLCHRKATPYH